ncbi:hypothetical protein KY328_03645 [Candidatus Woesearchaeota archaeon]|nr:hypothetical protein [Candidatus Woesearchaeota archaeon]
MAKKAASSLKIKKKRWIPVVAPKVFRNVVIGESHVLDPENLVGRIMKVNLMNLTNDIKKQNMYVDLKVKEIKNANAQTEVIGYGMTTASIKRVVRRNKDKIDDSFVVETANNLNVRVKPLMLTRNKASGSAKSSLVRINREKIAEYMKKNNYDTFVQEVISTKFQRGMREQLGKVYPLRLYEIRAFKIESKKIKKNSKIVAKEPKKEVPKIEAEEAVIETAEEPIAAE